MRKIQASPYTEIGFAPPSFFEQLEDRLNLAVFDTNHELRLKRINGLKREMAFFQRLRQNDRGVDYVETPLPVVDLLQPKGNTMSVTGLEPGAIHAALEKAKQRLAAKVAGGVATIGAATTAGEAKIDGVVSNLAAKIEKEIEDQVAEFVAQTNGGPV